MKLIYLLVFKFIAPKTFERTLPHKLTVIRVLYYIVQILLNIWIVLMLKITGGLFYVENFCSPAFLMTEIHEFWVNF